MTGTLCSDGVVAVSALFSRMSEDESFRLSLLRAAGDEARRAMVRAAGFPPFSLADVRTQTAFLLHTGQLAPCPRDPGWVERPAPIWSDASAGVHLVRRRAIILGALAAAACTDAGSGPVCPPLPVKLSYVIVGAVKAGTTALDHFLGSHPEICTAVQKETHFFVRDIFFRGSTPRYEWLDFCFPHYRGERAVGEATPEYMYFERAAERMRDYNPELKLILLLRDPAARAHSHYRMAVARNQERRPFSVALRDNLRDPREGTYTGGGFYFSCIQGLLRNFPREQLLVLRSDDLRHRHHETIRGVHAFLGVDPAPAPEPRQLLVSPAQALPPADRATLVRLYEAEVRSLEELLGWDLAAWRT